MNPPLSVTPALPSTGLVTTGSRHDRSTLETGRSGNALGPVPGLGLIVGGGVIDVAGAVTLGLGLMTVAVCDGPQARSTRPTIARSRLIVAAFNGPRGDAFRQLGDRHAFHVSAMHAFGTTRAVSRDGSTGRIWRGQRRDANT